jgi:hypothetical protein
LLIACDDMYNKKHHLAIEAVKHNDAAVFLKIKIFRTSMFLNNEHRFLLNNEQRQQTI